MTMKKLQILLIIFMAISSISCSGIADEEMGIKGSRGISISLPESYPNVHDIINDSYVFNEMEKAWKETCRLATPNGRQEIGFYIYYNHTMDKYSIGEWVYGPVTPNTTGSKSSLKIGAPTNNLTVCAFFHTHPPMKYVVGWRYCDPSSEDMSFAKSNSLPGIVCDFPQEYVFGCDYIHLPDDVADEYYQEHIFWPFGPVSRYSSEIIEYDHLNF